MDKVTKGERAAELMESPIFKAAVEGVRMAIHAQWAASPLRDIEGQQALRMELKLLDDLVGNIRSMVNAGKMETVRAHNTALDKIRRFAKVK